jgi:hypothetical protein
LAESGGRLPWHRAPAPDRLPGRNSRLHRSSRHPVTATGPGSRATARATTLRVPSDFPRRAALDARLARCRRNLLSRTSCLRPRREQLALGCMIG